MFKNQTNIIEHLKFKKKNVIRLSYVGVFVLWIAGYFMIQEIEGSISESYMYFAFGLAFAVISLVTAKFIPNDRDKTLDFFKFGMLGFNLYTILFEILLLACNLGGNDSTTTFSVLKSICGYSRVIIPIGMIIWQAKKWTFLTKVNKSKRQAIEHLKNHANDGMN